MHFLEWKLLNSNWYLIEICSSWFNWQCVVIGSDNGLAPNRRQAIIWTNDGLVYWRIGVARPQWVNTLRPRQNGRRFADNTFKRILVNENVIISTKISLKFVPKGLINNIPSLVQTRRQAIIWTDDGYFTDAYDICITRPQWVKQTPSLNSYLLRCRAGIRWWCITCIMGNPVMTHHCVLNERRPWFRHNRCFATINSSPSY